VLLKNNEMYAYLVVFKEKHYKSNYYSHFIQAQTTVFAWNDYRKTKRNLAAIFYDASEWIAPPIY
jgi:hypothetical protein